MSEDIFNESDSKEDDTTNAVIWGGETIMNNETILPTIISDLGFPVYIPQGRNTDTSPRLLVGRLIRPSSSSTQPRKYFKTSNGNRIIIRAPYTYIKLKSGEELCFNENDGNNLLIDIPDRLVRNILSIIPQRLSDRLEYLAKFINEDSEEDSDDDETINIKNRVYEAYIREWRLRFIFKRVLVLWRAYKMNKSFTSEVDPITLSYPEKEVIIYDWDNKKRFSFEAKSISLLIESKLSYQENGFPIPLFPKNPKTNIEFSYKQLISLYYQIKGFGEIRWGFTTLREYNFNKNRWQLYHKSLLTMNAIKISLTQLDTYEAKEMFLDFIFAKIEELNYTYNQYIYDVFKIAIASVPNHWYLDKLKALAISHYEGEHLGQVRTRIVNTGCQNVFRKLNVFIKDLKNKNIIK
jgi:hypothetical protein